MAAEITAPRRQDREVHRRRDHGGVRPAAPHEDDALRAVRAAAGMQAALRKRQRGPAGSATASRSPTAPASTPARWWPTTTRRPTRSWPPAMPSTSPRASSRRRRRTRSTSARRPIAWCATRSRSRAVEPLELKGKSERVAAYRLVSARAGWTATCGAHDTPIVGRDEELAALDRRCAEVDARRAACAWSRSSATPASASRAWCSEVIARVPAPARACCAAAACPTATASPSGRCARWPASAADIRADDSPEEAPRQARGAGRRRRRRRPPGRGDRPEHGDLPAARDLLGGAQVPRDAGRRRPAGRAGRRHPLGRAGVPRPARARARHVRGRADPAAGHRAPRPAREAARLGRAAGRRAWCCAR